MSKKDIDAFMDKQKNDLWMYIVNNNLKLKEIIRERQDGREILSEILRCNDAIFGADFQEKLERIEKYVKILAELNGVSVDTEED